MNETSKTKKHFGKLEERIFKGKGIDIGCGSDPIFNDVYKFDIEQGDANNITEYVKEQFDYVFSSHCLEHMYNPRKTLKEWWSLVKEGGYLYIVVPDEDLYEQGGWPSLFNGDHKNTFTIKKKKSWSPVSHNIADLISQLENVQIIKIELQDYLYDYSQICKNKDQTLKEASAQICCIARKCNISKMTNKKYLTSSKKIKNLLFSVKNEYTNDKKHKIITILGIKIKLKIS